MIDHPSSAFIQQLRARVGEMPGRWGVPLADSEDVLQDALAVMIAKWESIEDPERWLLGTLRNLCRLYWRQRRRRPVVAVSPAALEALEGGEPPAQERMQMFLDLETFWSRLPPRRREVVRLFYGLGMRPREVARQLGACAADSARRERCRAVAQMRSRARDEEPGHGRSPGGRGPGEGR